MARGVYVVQTRPSDPSVEDDYNAWYEDAHVPEILAVPGFLAARRYRRTEEDGTVSYLALYDIEADPVDAPLAELRRRQQAGQTTAPVGLQLDPPPSTALFELVSEQVGRPVSRQ